jgi:hypothetical protein
MLFITSSMSRGSMCNKHNHYFTIMLRTVPLIQSLPNSSSATLFTANLGTPSTTSENPLRILSISFHP